MAESRYAGRHRDAENPFVPGQERKKEA